MWLPTPRPQVISWSGGVKGRAVNTGTAVEVAGAVSCTHWVNGLRAPQVFWRSKTNPCPCKPFEPLRVSTFMRPPAACAPPTPTLPAIVSTERTAASLTEKCPPDHGLAIPCGSLISMPWLEVDCACEPGDAPEALPNASRVLAPSTEVSASCWPAGRRETCAEPGSAAEAGVSIMNSSQRRPVTGSDCSSEAGRVVVTAVETGSPCCEAV